MRIPQGRMNAAFYSPGRKKTRSSRFSRMILMTALLLSGGFSGRCVLAEVRIIEADSSHPQKKEQTLRVIEECGGDRPGRQRRTRES